MRTPAAVCILLVSLVSCGESPDAEDASAGGGPRATIAALSKALRDRDFEAFAGLHTENCYEMDARAWRRGQERILADPDLLRQEAERLGLSETEVRSRTWNGALVEVLRYKVAEDPNWVRHLEALQVLEERTEGDTSRVTVRYGEPKPDEVHELLLVRRDGRWLVREWD